nr:MAG TPA: hypothetical protein [Caudoviricetes sp.]
MFSLLTQSYKSSANRNLKIERKPVSIYGS